MCKVQRQKPHTFCDVIVLPPTVTEAVFDEDGFTANISSSASSSSMLNAFVTTAEVFFDGMIVKDLVVSSADAAANISSSVVTVGGATLVGLDLGGLDDALLNMSANRFSSTSCDTGFAAGRLSTGSDVGILLLSDWSSFGCFGLTEQNHQIAQLMQSSS